MTALIVTLVAACAAILCARLAWDLTDADDPWLSEVEDAPLVEVPDWYGGSQLHTCAAPPWYVPCLDRPTTVRSFRIRPVSYVGSAT